MQIINKTSMLSSLPQQSSDPGNGIYFFDICCQGQVVILDLFLVFAILAPTALVPSVIAYDHHGASIGVCKK
jgi:hypothetical protein